MKIKNDFNSFFFIFFSLLPLSIVFGPSISLFNIIILILIYLYIFFHKDHYKILINNNVIKLLFFIYFYLIFNKIISIDYEIGLIRNLGFIGLILIFILINYFFFLCQNNLKIFNFWTFLIFIIVLDVYVERFTGTNVFGWGAEEINGIKHPASIFSLWSESERNAIGVYTVEIDTTNFKAEEWYINTNITYAYD